MIRFLCFLLGKPYETCKSCETLKAQLAFVNEEKKQLTDTLINILHPKVVEAAPIEINQVTQTAGLFSRRRAVLEARDRQEALIKKNSPNIAQPDDRLKDIDRLESELGITEKEA